MQYGNPCEADPIAVHNGLVWWTLEDNLIPTFVDLQTDKVYCRRDTIFATPFDDLKLCQNTHYLMCVNKRGADDISKKGKVVYDLESGKSVLIQQPYKLLIRIRVHILLACLAMLTASFVPLCCKRISTGTIVNKLQ